MADSITHLMVNTYQAHYGLNLYSSVKLNALRTQDALSRLLKERGSNEITVSAKHLEDRARIYLHISHIGRVNVMSKGDCELAFKEYRLAVRRARVPLRVEQLVNQISDLVELLDILQPLKDAVDKDAVPVPSTDIEVFSKLKARTEVLVSSVLRVAISSKTTSQFHKTLLGHLGQPRPKTSILEQFKEAAQKVPDALRKENKGWQRTINKEWESISPAALAKEIRGKDGEREDEEEESWNILVQNSDGGIDEYDEKVLDGSASVSSASSSRADRYLSGRADGFMENLEDPWDRLLYPGKDRSKQKKKPSIQKLCRGTAARFIDSRGLEIDADELKVLCQIYINQTTLTELKWSTVGSILAKAGIKSSPVGGSKLALSIGNDKFIQVDNSLSHFNKDGDIGVILRRVLKNALIRQFDMDIAQFKVVE